MKHLSREGCHLAILVLLAFPKILWLQVYLKQESLILIKHCLTLMERLSRSGGMDRTEKLRGTGIITTQGICRFHTITSGKMERGEDHLPPSPDYEFSLEPIIGITIATVCAVGIVVVVANDLTGVGVLDDFLLGPLVAGLQGGLIEAFV